MRIGGGLRNGKWSWNFIYVFELILVRNGVQWLYDPKNKGGLYYLTNEHHHANSSTTIWRVHSPKPSFQSATKVQYTMVWAWGSSSSGWTNPTNRWNITAGSLDFCHWGIWTEESHDFRYLSCQFCCFWRVFDHPGRSEQLTCYRKWAIYCPTTVLCTKHPRPATPKLPIASCYNIQPTGQPKDWKTLMPTPKCFATCVVNPAGTPSHHRMVAPGHGWLDVHPPENHRHDPCVNVDLHGAKYSNKKVILQGRSRNSPVTGHHCGCARCVAGVACQ